jgi:hypothetical protein
VTPSVNVLNLCNDLISMSRYCALESV